MTHDVDAWYAEGAQLAAALDVAAWRLADWIADGQARFGDDAPFTQIAARLHLSPKRLKAAKKTAVVYSAEHRQAGIGFEHHQAVMHLPVADGCAILRKAERLGWDDRETRIAAVARRAELNPPLPPDHDPEHEELLRITRAWNRASRCGREAFRDLADEAGMGLIDA